MSEASTGSPAAIASRTGSPKPSHRVGIAIARARPYRSVQLGLGDPAPQVDPVLHARLGHDGAERIRRPGRTHR